MQRRFPSVSGNLEVMRAPGVYVIGNKVTGKIYIGMSCDVSRRLSEHRRSIGSVRRGTLLYGATLDMWRDCNGAYGNTFELVECVLLVTGEIRDLERSVFDHYEKCGAVFYNKMKAGSGSGRHSAATREKMSRDRKANAAHISAVTRAAMANPEVRAKCASGKRLVGKRHPLSRAVLNLTTGESFDTVSEAALSIGAGSGMLSGAIRNASFVHKRYCFCYLDEKEQATEAFTEKILQRSVVCIETGVMYLQRTCAANASGVPITTLTSAITARRKCGGFTFRKAIKGDLPW